MHHRHVRKTDLEEIGSFSPFLSLLILLFFSSSSSSSVSQGWLLWGDEGRLTSTEKTVMMGLSTLNIGDEK